MMCFAGKKSANSSRCVAWTLTNKILERVDFHGQNVRKYGAKLLESFPFLMG